MATFTVASSCERAGVKALVFGAAPTARGERARTGRRARAALLSMPFGLHIVDDATPIRPDWVVTRPILSGICGSDAKLVLGDFGDGDVDNPMSAFSSLPHVPGPRGGGRGRRARARSAGASRSATAWCSTRGSPAGHAAIDPLCPPVRRET